MTTEFRPTTTEQRDLTSTSSAATLASLKLHWRGILICTVLATCIGAGVSFVIPPTFTSRISFLSPQPQQNPAAAALSSLGALSGLAGAAGLKSQTDQYLALMQSVTVADRIIERFKLSEVYETKYSVDARKELAKNVRINAGKKDGLISVEVDDEDKARAAAMANAYLEELKTLSNGLSLTEAQQRRSFFEKNLLETRDRLSKAQERLQQVGFNPGALKNEPKAAAETYAKLKAETTSAEVKLQTFRAGLTDDSTEVRRQAALVSSLREQLAKLERPLDGPANQDYVSAYRDYKYQEALFDIYARQFELAKLDESRDGALFQVVDIALPAERRSKPKRAFITAASLLAGLVLSIAFFGRPWSRRQTSFASGAISH